MIQSGSEKIIRVIRVIRGQQKTVDLTPYRTFIAELAEKSGEFIRPFFGRSDLAVETKADASPVTQADRGGGGQLPPPPAQKILPARQRGQAVGPAKARAR